MTTDPPRARARLELDAVVDGAPIGILFTHNRLMDQANPRLCAMFGYQLDELIGQPASLLFFSTPHTYEELGRIAGPALAQGQPFHAVLPGSRKDGSLIWLRSSAKAINPEQTQDGTVWFIEDVTAEHEQAETLRHTLDEQQTIFENATVGILYSNQRTVTRCNKRLANMFGYEPPELLGQSTRVFYPSDDVYEEIGHAGSALLQAGQSFTTEMQLPHRDGHLMWIHISGRQVAGAQRSSEDIIWILEDVSEQREAQDALRHTQSALAQAEKLAALGSLVVGVAHELNTPIGVSLTAASTLQDRSQALYAAVGRGDLRRSQLDNFLEELTGLAGLITRSCERAAELVSGFKQVAADRKGEQLQAFNLRAVVDACVAVQRQKFPDSPCRILLDIPQDIECVSYPSALTQVVNNLIHNALTHAFGNRDHGHLKIVVAPGEPLELRFEDDGVGMSPATLGRIFDPFFTTRLGQGRSGLGLSISRNVATAVLGGELTAASQETKGSCFFLRFPREAPQH